jgi:hypothetical protein
MIPHLAIARAFLGKIPREVWYALAVLAAVWWIRADAHNDGRESVLTELREAEDKAREKAAKVIEEADKAGAKRAQIEAETRAADIQAIEKAEANDTNSLDAIF